MFIGRIVRRTLGTVLEAMFGWAVLAMWALIIVQCTTCVTARASELNTRASSLASSPLTWPECLNRELAPDLITAGAEDWEREAIEAVAYGRTGRDLTTLTGVSCGSAGFASFLPQRLGLNMGWKGPCAWEDSGWRYRVLEVLYSDASASVQLAAWRHISGRAIQEAWSHGIPRPLAAIACNGGPNAFLRAAEERDWDQAEIVVWYVSGGDTDRRKFRVRSWL